MAVKIYQAYYDDSQIPHLDKEFIPFDNRENLAPHLREYPFHKRLFWENKNSNDYWGLVSWKWKEKTELPAIDFINWIENNPGYDVYHIDPNLDATVYYPNLWVQGDRWHPGLLNYAKSLFPKIGITEDIEKTIWSSEDFATVNYFIGNSKFWTEWFLFLDNALVISSQHDDLYAYLYKQGAIYNGNWLPFFIFVVERLVSMFFIKNRNIKVKKFPVDHESFAKRFGNNHAQMVRMYNDRIKND